MNANPYSSYPESHQPQQSPLWKKVLAFLSLAFGAMMLFAGAASGMFLFGLFIAVASGLPGAWWLIHERREKKGAQPLKRHWITITIVSIMMFYLSVVFLPETEPTDEESDPASSSSSSTPTSSTEETTSQETTTSEEPTTTTSETSTTESEPSTESEQPTSEPQPVPDPDNDDDDVDRHPAPPARQPAPARAKPAPAPAPEPAPAPAQYFSNCSEAKRAGAAPLYAGSPGYRSGLDRDGDGVACEK